MLRGIKLDYEFRDATQGPTTNLEATEKWADSKKKQQLIETYDRVNIAGKQKIINYAADIAGNPDYKRNKE